MLTGICGLCKENRSLRDSHLIAATFYKGIQKAAIADGAPNVNPVIVTPEVAMHVSNQVSDYFLCADCEQLLSLSGEKWMSENCWHSDSDFPLRDALLRATPVHDNGKERAYKAHEVAGVDVPKLIHFASGVFWRAAAREWSPILEHVPKKLQLGPYEEQLRAFVKGEAVFPKSADLVVTVSSETAPGANQSVIFPYLRTQKSGCNQFMFCIQGVIFQLFLGGQIPQDFRQISIAEPPDHLIFLGSNDFGNADMWKLLQKAQPKGSLTK